jgi:hypothetical protein
MGGDVEIWSKKSTSIKNIFCDSCGLYYKHTTIVNYVYSVVSEQIFQLIDDARVVIYDLHVFIVQATDAKLIPDTINNTTE